MPIIPYYMAPYPPKEVLKECSWLVHAIREKMPTDLLRGSASIGKALCSPKAPCSFMVYTYMCMYLFKNVYNMYV